jgi:outer membrane protein OmpA-like peptidoglycan-associated protein
MGRTLTKNPNLFIEIQGHTDSSGDEKKNTEISRLRAQSVKDYLVRKHGINSERLLVRGFGPKFPLKSNETVEGREANRRVQAKILSK